MKITHDNDIATLTVTEEELILLYEALHELRLRKVQAFIELKEKCPIHHFQPRDFGIPQLNNMLKVLEQVS